MITIDLGNKRTTITDNQLNRLQIPTTILFKSGNIIQIGHKRQTKCIVHDFVEAIGLKFSDGNFINSMKFYAYNFEKSEVNSLEIVLPVYQQMLYQKLTVQCLTAIFILKLVRDFLRNHGKTNAISAYKYFFIIPGGSTHRYRYALKIICSTIGIHFPCFVLSANANISAFYLRNLDDLQPNDYVLSIDSGDLHTTIACHKLHSEEQMIIQTLSISSIKIGGINLTRTISEYILECMKREEGIDIKKHAFFMNQLSLQCENAKRCLSCEDEHFIRIANLPSKSTYGKIVTQKDLEQLFKEDLNLIMLAIEQVYQKYQDKISKVVLSGSNCSTLAFHKRISNYFKEVTIITSHKQWMAQGPFAAYEQQLVIFDVAESQYYVTGEQNLSHKFLRVGDSIPVRESLETKFPAGELELNLRVFEDDVKVAHFTLEARPLDPIFNLYFQYDRNRLITMFVVTQKGKINLRLSFDTYDEEKIAQTMKIIQEYNVQEIRNN